MKRPISRTDYAVKRMLNDTLINHCAGMGTARVPAFPALLNLDVNNSCNLRCTFCTNKLRRDKNHTSGKMSFKRFRSILDPLGPYLQSINFGDKSEPTLNKDLYKMIDYATNKYGIPCYLTTNFNILSKSDAGKIISSRLAAINVGMDGTTQKTYGKYRRGGNLARVIKNIELVQKLKNSVKTEKPVITIRYVVFKHNESQIPEAKKLARKLGARIEFLPAAVFNVGLVYKDWLPKNSKYSKYTIKEGSANGERTLKISHKPIKAQCRQPWYSLVVDASGLVYPCCGEHDAEYSAGNIFKSRFDDIWNGEMFRNVRTYLARKKVQAAGAVPCVKCYDLPKDPEIYYPKKAN